MTKKFLHDTDLDGNKIVSGKAANVPLTVELDAASTTNPVLVQTSAGVDLAHVSPKGTVFAGIEIVRANKNKHHEVLGSERGPTETSDHPLIYRYTQRWDGAKWVADAGIGIGELAGAKGSCESLVAVGQYAAREASGKWVVAIGLQAAMRSTGNQDVTAIGNLAAADNTGHNVVAIGSNAGRNNAGTSCIMLGAGAGQDNKGSTVIAIGQNAAQTSGGSVVAVGNDAAKNATGNVLTAIGHTALMNIIGGGVVAVGGGAGQWGSGATDARVTLVGSEAGGRFTGNNQTLLGWSAGKASSGDTTTAVGHTAGQYNSGSRTAFVGFGAGANNTGASAVAIGNGAGSANTGDDVVAIGRSAQAEVLDHGNDLTFDETAIHPAAVQMTVNGVNSHSVRKVTIPNHGLGAAGTRIPFSPSNTQFWGSAGTTPTLGTWTVVDDDTLSVEETLRATPGTHTLTPMVKVDDVIAIGAHAVAATSKTVQLGSNADPFKLGIGNSGYGNPGESLTVNAAGDGVKWAAGGGGGAAKFATDVVLTANTWATVTHNLNTTDFTIALRNGNEGIEFDWEVVDANNIRVRGTVAGTRRVVVIG